MKTNIAERNIEQSGNFSESQFTIKASRKAFKILSDSLYSDKIKAIIRELSCNAYDAHVDANNLDTPFDIHLPSRLNPSFYIRDYGIGLSRDQVENLYTTYFESTKTESNDVVGCLGLGSKSPFSYTTMFTVTSYYEGVKYTFNSMLNSDGFPSIMLINECSTDEHNGLKIEFAVKPDDHYSFSRKAEDVFKYFSVQPKFLNSDVKIEPVNYSTFVKGSYGVRLGSSWNSKSNAIMGNVAYPITIDKCGLSTREIDFLKNVDVDMFFKIGELDVAASREGLSYDDATTQCIKNRIVNIIKTQLKELRDNVKTQPSYWDAVTWYTERRKNDQLVRHISNIDDFSYGGKQLNSRMKIEQSEYKIIDNEFSIYSYQIKKRWQRSSNMYVPTISSVGVYQGREMHLSPSLTHIFINDCTTCNKMRVKKYVLEKELIDGTVVLVKCSDNMKDKIVNKLKSDLMISSVQNLSEITIEKVKRSSTKSANIKSMQGDFFSWRGVSWRNSECWGVLTDSDIEEFDREGGIIIPINRWKPVFTNFFPAKSDYSIDTDSSEENSILEKLFDALSSNDANMPKIYGVKTSKYEKFLKIKGVVSFGSYLDKFLNKFIPKNDLLLASSYINSNTTFQSHSRLMDFWNEKYTKINCSLLRDFVDSYNLYNAVKKDISNDMGKFIKLFISYIKLANGSNILHSKYSKLQKDLANQGGDLRSMYRFYDLAISTWINERSIKEQLLEYINWKSSNVKLSDCEVSKVGDTQKKSELTSCI